MEVKLVENGYPERENRMILSSGNNAEDQDGLEKSHRLQRAIAEGMCPNKRGPLFRVSKTRKECPKCGFGNNVIRITI